MVQHPADHEGIPSPFGAATSVLGADKPARRAGDGVFHVATAAEVAEVQAILDRYRITPEAIQVLADAERAGITAGTIVQLRTPNPNRPAP
jgi:hypothetical protein